VIWGMGNFTLQSVDFQRNIAHVFSTCHPLRASKFYPEVLQNVLLCLEVVQNYAENAVC
jgi:hypothetical protein